MDYQDYNEIGAGYHWSELKVRFEVKLHQADFQSDLTYALDHTLQV